MPATRGGVCAAWTTHGWSAGPSRRSRCASFPAGVHPDPGRSCGARARYFPPDSGLPPVRTRSALRTVPCRDFRPDPLAGRHSFLAVQARRCARHPGRSSRYGPVRMPAVTFPSAPLVVRDLPTPRICYPSASGTSRDGDFHPISCAALSAAPRTLALSRARLVAPRLQRAAARSLRSGR